MLQKINLIENIGKFKKTPAQEAIACSFITLVYAENGRGKSTLASLLRSLSDNNPSIIASRERLEGEGKPRASLKINGRIYSFQDKEWGRRQFHNIKIFDDVFVDENIYSGLATGMHHRANLHRFIVFGKERVALCRKLEEQERKCSEATMRCHRARRAVKVIAAKYRLSVEEFCAIKKVGNIEEKIKHFKGIIQMAKSPKEMRAMGRIKPLSLPSLSLREIESFLNERPEKVRETSWDLVRQHIDGLSNNGETWLQEGLQRLHHSSSSPKTAECPFCQQSVADIKIVSLYQEYFNREYLAIQRRARSFIDDLKADHGEQKRLLFQNQCFAVIQLHSHWKKRIGEMPKISIEVQAIAEAWKEASELLLDLLQKKLSSPLQAKRLHLSANKAIDKYEKSQARIKEVSEQIANANKLIGSFRRLARKGNVQDIQKKVALLEIHQNRHEGEGKEACAEYAEARQSMIKLQEARDKLSEHLSRSMEGVYSNMETLVNKFLVSFGATFQISGTQFISGPLFTANYLLEIGNRKVRLVDSSRKPSFKTVLSTGDRGALSLSFFLSHMYSQKQGSLKKQVVVFDDPMTSLDEHRSYETMLQLCRLSSEVRQIIVLSHSKDFLFDFYSEMLHTLKNDNHSKPEEAISAHILTRGEDMSSEIEPWDIKNHCMSDNHKRLRLVQDYIRKQDPKRYYEVGASLRLILEHRIAATFAEHHEPGERVSEFARRAADKFLDDDSCKELKEIKTYLNGFHHNISFGNSKALSDHELLQFCKRTLRFHPRAKNKT